MYDSEFSGYDHKKIDEGIYSSIEEGMKIYYEKYELYALYEGEYMGQNSGRFEYGIVDSKKIGTYFKYGFVDEDDNRVINAVYSDVKEFSEGLACVCKRNRMAGETKEKWGFINQSGKQVVPFIFDDAISFKEGYAFVKIKYKWGVIDKGGNLIRDFDFDSVKEFINGGAVVMLEDKQGVIDKEGFYKIAPIYDDIILDGWNKAIHIMKSEKWGCLDNNYDKLIKTEFDQIIECEEGFMVTKHGKWGFIDDAGNEIVEVDYDEIIRVEKEVIVVRKSHLWGLIDKEGNVVLECIYDKIGKFEDGVADVRINELWGLIDNCGNYLISPYYKNVWNDEYNSLKNKEINKLKKL